MEIKNKGLKIKMLETFIYATINTLEEFAEFTQMLPPFVKEIKVEIIMDLVLQLKNEEKITEIDRKIRVLEALFELNSTIIARNIPENYGVLGAENKMKLISDLTLLGELIGELKEVQKNNH